MPQLVRDVVVWSDALGTRAIPLVEGDEESRLDDDEPLSSDPQSVRFIGAYPAGTVVHDVVDVGEEDRVRCTIDGQRVTTSKWALSDTGELGVPVPRLDGDVAR